LASPPDDRRREGATEPQAVDGFAILEKLAGLPISSWSYKRDDPAVRHLGPMAQDFFAAFGLGGDDRMINMVDANGVVMVAIQALYRRLHELQAEVAELRASLERGQPSP
jgi:hypothetical protein